MMILTMIKTYGDERGKSQISTGNISRGNTPALPVHSNK